MKLKGIKFDRILFFCHGAKYNLNRKMISMTKTEDVNTVKFCNRLGAIAARGCGIVFYSCKTAAVDDGFSDTVMQKTGLKVVGHTTSGHTTRNPNKIGFIPFMYQIDKMWLKHGGVKPMKKLMNSHKYEPFRVAEEWFTK